jgi:hypothetical protein
MIDDTSRPPRDARRRFRRALSLSVIFPALAWFFADWFGLVIAIGAVTFWWLAIRPLRTLWGLAVVSLAAAPVALWLQGLPRTKVVGATFGSEHWMANKLVVASLVLASFAGLTELLQIEFEHSGPDTFSRRMARRFLARTRQRFDGTGQRPADRQL